MNYYYLKKIFFPLLFTSFLSFILLNRFDLSRAEIPVKISDTKFVGCTPEDIFLFQHRNGGGHRLRLCHTAHQSVNNLSKECMQEDFFGNCDPSWNDRISSVGGDNLDVTLWEQTNRKGKCITVNPNGRIINLNEYGFEDMAGSVALGEFSGCRDLRFSMAARPGMSGIYRGVNVWGVLRITNFNSGGNPLTFSADDNNENQYFTHFTNGTLTSVKAEELIWNITTKRTNRSSGCTTMMSGTLTQRSNNTARAVYTSTDGRCDIPTNFSSVTEFRKN